MECLKTFLVLLLLFVTKCAIAEEQACHAGNCTDGTTESTTKVTSNVTGGNNDATETPFIFVTPPHPESQRSRAINFTAEEHDTQNELLTNKTTRVPSKDKDLSDVTMDDNEEEDEEALGKNTAGGNLAGGICVKGGLTYSNGERIEDDCESVCVCMNGKMECKPRCMTPFVKRGKAIQDPLCVAKPAEDICCSVLVCEADTETEPLEMCVHGNKTFDRGEKFNDGCSQVCTCEAAGKMSCKPRCRPLDEPSDRCVPVQDPEDSCCKKLLCDVSLDDHEHQETPKLKLISAKYINMTTIRLKFDTKADDTRRQLELSADKGSWVRRPILAGGFVDATGAKAGYARLENSNDYVIIRNDTFSDVEDMNRNCTYNGTQYEMGAEFYEGCKSFCKCFKGGVQCLPIQCPTYFGLDIVDPECIEWEVMPTDFVAEPPRCCPEKVRCKNNGSCVHNGVTYRNWDKLPVNATGCEKTCHCELGNIDCQPTCPPVAAGPPPTLPCPAQRASLRHLPDDDCCLTWACSAPDEPPPSIRDDVSKKTDNHANDTLIHKSPNPKRNHTVTSDFNGPLLIYENDKPQTVNETDLQNLHVDTADVTTNTEAPPYLGPFVAKAPFKNPPPVRESEMSPAYVGPFNPDFKGSGSTKTRKGDKTTNNIAPGKQKPVVRPPPPPPQRPQYDIKPDEIIHVINQHPELANYPPGSVFEVHNYNPNQPGAYPSNFPARPPLVPNQLDAGFPIDLIKHVHNGQIPPGVAANYAPNPYAQFPFMNGQSQLTPNRTGFPPFPSIPGTPYQSSPDAINVQQVEAIDGRTVRLIFSVSSLIVGLHGRVEVRYTNKQDDDPERWDVQVFAPPNDLIATQQMEFDLIGLEPGSDYRIKITIMLRDLHNTPTSRVYMVRTPAASSTPPVIHVDPQLKVLEANATWANVGWRKLDNNELQFVDGVQLRYKEITGKVYAATPLIHRAVTDYLLENLKPDTRYEVGVFFIPFAGQTTELQADKGVNFTTARLHDPYGFNVTLQVEQIKATSVDVSWAGVPYPEDKYVNIYRAIYQSDSGKGDQSTFKIAKRDSPTRTTIMDLKPGTRYRLWLEIYLTSGRIATSNVLDFVTKPRPLGTAPSQLASERNEDPQPDYYGPLVVVAILAAVAVLSALFLLAMLVRRRAHNKANISASTTTVSQSAYDNPTYKVEIQQETMDL